MSTHNVCFCGEDINIFSCKKCLVLNYVFHVLVCVFFVFHIQYVDFLYNSTKLLI